jgi:predicted ABC-type ATPase
LESFEIHSERIKLRADRSGHSAPESLLRSIYDSSIRNLPRVIREMDFLYVYDNSRWGLAPLVLVQAEKGEIQYLAQRIPSWLATALKTA